MDRDHPEDGGTRGPGGGTQGGPTDPGRRGAARRPVRQGYPRPRRDHPYDPRVLNDLAQVFMETTLREDGTVIRPDRREALALAEQVLDILYYSGFYNAADVAGLRFHLYPRLEADGQPDLIYANTWMEGRWMEIAVIEVPRPNARPPEDGDDTGPRGDDVRPGDGDDAGSTPPGTEGAADGRTGSDGRDRGADEPGRNGRVPPDARIRPVAPRSEGGPAARDG
ncbi:MAG TPA: hypothetical protein VIK99_05150 [Thermaerobacter sp.]